MPLTQQQFQDLKASFGIEPAQGSRLLMGFSDERQPLRRDAIAATPALRARAPLGRKPANHYPFAVINARMGSDLPSKASASLSRRLIWPRWRHNRKASDIAVSASCRRKPQRDQSNPREMGVFLMGCATHQNSEPALLGASREQLCSTQEGSGSPSGLELRTHQESDR